MFYVFYFTRGLREKDARKFRFVVYHKSCSLFVVAEEVNIFFVASKYFDISIQIIIFYVKTIAKASGLFQVAIGAEDFERRKLTASK